MHATVSRVAVVTLAGLFAATGCVTQLITTEIRADGSGTNTFEVGLDAGFFAMIDAEGDGPLDLQAITERVEALPESWNARYETFERDNLRGVRITTDFADLAEMTEQLNTLLAQIAESEGDGEAGFEVTPVLREVAVRGEEDGTARLSARAHPVAPGEVDAETIETFRGIFGESTFGWTVVIPELSAYTPEEITKDAGDDAVHFSFEFGESYDVEVTGSLEPGAVADHLVDDDDEAPFDPARIKEYLQGTWRIDLEAMRATLQAQGLEAEQIEEGLQELAELRVRIDGPRFVLVEGDSEELLEFRIIVRTDRSLTLQDADGERFVITFEDKRRITFYDEESVEPLSLVRE